MIPRMPALMLLALALALPAGAPAQEIVGPTSPIAEHTLARLNVEGVEGASWMVLPGERVDLVEGDDGRQLLFTAPPGVYAVLAAVVVEGRPKFLKTSVTVRGTSPAIEPAVVEPKPEARPPAPPASTPTDGDLERAARAYADSVPTGLREAAGLVRSGQATNVNAVVDVVARRREQARAAYGRALDAATVGSFDATGRIADPARYSTALERAAAAMGGAR